MVTKQQALTANEFHWDGCLRIVGPRGGIQENIIRYRRNGRTQTWITRPNEYRVPIVFGLKSYAQLTHNSTHSFHITEECPILNACCSCAAYGKRNAYCFCKCHTV